MDPTEYAERLPNLFHLTAAANLARITRTRSLTPASELMLAAGREDLLSVRRPTHVAIAVEGEAVSIRDQKPLHAGHIDFDDGWDLARLVKHLNRRVFFWPGRAGGPSDYGERHFERYESEDCRVLRVPFRSLCAENSGLLPLYSSYNSGSPRTVNGRRSPRGAETFVPSSRFAGRPSSVAEVTFPGPVRLPLDTMVATSSEGPWAAL